MAPTQPLTPQELAIMKVVWRLGTATVRDVHDVLRKEHRDDLAYTTVLTMMRILEQKGVLAKDASAESRAHRYRPVRSQRQMMRLMVREFVDRVFDGAADSLVAHLVSDRKLSARDRAEIRKLLDQGD
jgi:predicted transcriptional regulator